MPAAASATAAILACAKVPTRKDDGKTGSRPVRTTSRNAAGAPSANAHSWAKMSEGMAAALRIVARLAWRRSSRGLENFCVAQRLQGCESSVALGDVLCQPTRRAQQASIVAARTDQL